MIAKILLASIMVTTTLGFLFFAARKLPIAEAFYEKTDVIVVNDQALPNR